MKLSRIKKFCFYLLYGNRSEEGINFSQYGEQFIIRSIFDVLGIKEPSYVDFGASHPFRISNTASLYHSGSRGINIDPNPESIKKFMKFRPLDINLNMGVSDRAGTLTYYIFNKPFSELNTFSPEHRDDSLRRYRGIKLVKEQEIEVFTLPEILKKYNNGIYPDYMSIDVEGLESGILATCDFTPENSPIAITVEGANPELHREHTAILTEKGYVPYARTGVNITYVRKNEYEKLFNS